MSAVGDVLRPVGVLEKLYIARQVLGIYRSVISTATYTIPSTLIGAFLEPLLSAAIVPLLEHHPGLCCYFEDQISSKPYFRRLDTIDLKDVLQIRDLGQKETLPDILEELHDQQWSADRKPLWKIIVIQKPREDHKANSYSEVHIAFVYHHIIGDGLSGPAFHRSLLREMKNIEKSNIALRQPLNIIKVPSSTRLSQPIEKLTALPLSWLFLIRQIISEYTPRWFSGAPSPPWAGLPVQTLDKCPFRSRVRLVSIKAKNLKVLLKESRRHGVTLTALLTAAIVYTLARAVPGATRFQGTTPYSLRRLTDVSMDDIAVQVSSLWTSYPADLLDRTRQLANAAEHAESLWNIAHYFQTQMQNELQKCPSDNIIGLLPYVSDSIKFYQMKFDKARGESFELSNLGIVKVDEESVPRGWGLQGMTFTQGAQPAGAAVTLNCVSVQGGPLTIAITWQESVVQEDIVDALAQEFEELTSFLQRASPS